MAAASNLARLRRNRPDKVVAVTCEAFKIYAKNNNILQAIDCLKSLRGVGLTTATLILSTAYSNNVPFFSDALCHWLGLNDLNKVVSGYKTLVESVDAVRRRVQSSSPRRRRITALDVERVAFAVAASKYMQGIRLASDPKHRIVDRLIRR